MNDRRRNKKKDKTVDYFNTYVYCQDPDSKAFYKLNLVTQEVDFTERTIEHPSAIDDIRELANTNILSAKEERSWYYVSSEADRYRRRELKNYLIQKEATPIPYFITDAKLSDDFKNKYTMLVRVSFKNYLSYDEADPEKVLELLPQAKDDHYSHLLTTKTTSPFGGRDGDDEGGSNWLGDFDGDKATFMQSIENKANRIITHQKGIFSSSSLGPEVELELEINLLTGTNEILKKFLREMYKIHKIQLKPRSDDNKFVLKICGSNEYLTGNQPVINYQWVRECLRNEKPLRCNVSETIKSTRQEHQFPVLIQGKDNLEKAADMRYYDRNYILNVAAFVWYPPFKIPEELLRDTGVISDEDDEEDEEEGSRSRQFNREGVSFYKHPIHKRTDQVLTLEDLNMLQRNKVMKKKDSGEVLYSGDCDARFRIQIVGILDLHRVFQQGYLGDACDNGTLEPTYTKGVGLTSLGKRDKKEKKEKFKKNADYRTPASVGKGNIPKGMTSQRAEDEGLFNRLHLNHGGISSAVERMTKDFRIPIVPFSVHLVGGIYYGDTELESFAQKVEPVPFSVTPRWDQWINFRLSYSRLPQEARLCINIVVRSHNGEEKTIGCCCHSFFDENGVFSQGMHTLNVWPLYSFEPRLCCMKQFFGHVKYRTKEVPHSECYNEDLYTRFLFRTETFASEFKWNLRTRERARYLRVDDEVSQDAKTLAMLEKKPETSDFVTLQYLLSKDPLWYTAGCRSHDLLLAEGYENYKEIMIMCRHYCKTLPHALPLFLTAIDWTQPLMVEEAHNLLEEWEPMEPQDAIALLDCRFQDETVRLYAVERVNLLSDEDLDLYMLQLIQALSFENHHLSALGEMLLERALKNPALIGHSFYWNLKSQLYIKAIHERFYLLLEQFLMLCGKYREVLSQETAVTRKLTKLAITVKGIKEKNFPTDFLAHVLRLGLHTQVASKESFTVPLDSRKDCNNFVLEQCKVMDSKKLPFFMTLRNVEVGERPIRIIFKEGDDVRQDILTLQIIRIMDKIWMENGLDLRLKPYRVVATGDQVGMLQVVENSETYYQIQRFAAGPFDMTSIMKYIQTHNTTPTQLARAIDNFKRSCAGYCVATYLMGVGDRHPGNMMVSKEGHFFHIDFGHILGNFKSKFGVKRERSPFRFAPSMKYVMDEGKTYQEFQDLCCEAYNQVRANSDRIVNLFLMMTSAGLPELQKPDDILYLTEMLAPEITNQEASKRFKREIETCLGAVSRQLDDWFHYRKHG